MNRDEMGALAVERLDAWLAAGVEPRRTTPLEEHLWAVRATAAKRRVEYRAGGSA